jgi:hypothetical protein
VPGYRWAAAGLGRCAANQEEREGVGVAARGWVHAVCFVVAMINSLLVGCGQRVVWVGAYAARAFLRGCPDCRIWSNGRAMGLSNE